METRQTKNGKRYREMLWVRGKAIKGPFFKRKSDAKEWKSQEEERIRYTKLHGLNVEQAELTVEEFFTIWLQTVIEVKCSESTFRNYHRYFKVHILPVIGDSKLVSLKRSDIDRIVISLREKGNNNKGINDIVGSLKSLMSEARRQGMILHSPLEFYPPLPVEPRVDNFFTKDEITKFLASQKKLRLHSLYIVAFYTGMRRGELLGLKWDRVDFVHNHISITRTRSEQGLKETTKSNKKRFIPMSAEVRSALLKLVKDQSLSDYVFTDNDGKEFSPDYVSRHFIRVQRKSLSNKIIRFHDIRHSFASNYMMNGGSIFELQKILGHSTISMTERYSHFTNGHLQNSLQFMKMELRNDRIVDKGFLRLC